MVSVSSTVDECLDLSSESMGQTDGSMGDLTSSSIEWASFVLDPRNNVEKVQAEIQALKGESSISILSFTKACRMVYRDITQHPDYADLMQRNQLAEMSLGLRKRIVEDELKTAWNSAKKREEDPVSAKALIDDTDRCISDFMLNADLPVDCFKDTYKRLNSENRIDVLSNLSASVDEVDHRRLSQTERIRFRDQLQGYLLAALDIETEELESPVFSISNIRLIFTITQRLGTVAKEQFCAQIENAYFSEEHRAVLKQAVMSVEERETASPGSRILYSAVLMISSSAWRELAKLSFHSMMLKSIDIYSAHIEPRVKEPSEFGRV